MEIKENLTLVNYNKGENKQNKYIVIHYVGAVSTAYNNSVYFKKVNRNASANYFVDETSIYRVVKDEDIAWHCGAKTYKHKDCRNNNSIGIEMCCYSNNGTIDISDKVVKKTIELTKELMKKYNIPAENVIRHYDVTNKNCPAPFVKDASRWTNFKNQLVESKPEVKPSTSSFKAGAKYNLKNSWLYTSANAKKHVTAVTGTYYLWSGEVVNDKIRITNKSSNVGKSGQVTGWINVIDIQGRTATVTNTPKYYKKYTGKSGSIAEALKSIGVNNSFSNRAKIAKKNGIKLYIGTAKQNITLLNLLKQGKLIQA